MQALNFPCPLEDSFCTNLALFFRNSGVDVEMQEVHNLQVFNVHVTSEVLLHRAFSAFVLQFSRCS